MVPTVGVFKSREGAAQSVRELRRIGIAESRITTLTPEVSKSELSSVVTTTGEQPGMLRAIGAVVGGAVGAGVVETLAAILVPGVGPVVAIGLAGGAILGALTGGAIGNAAEHSAFGGLPQEELFVYEDALRKGRTVVIATTDSELQAETARGALEKTGAESINRARYMWWVGLRDVEKEKYTGGDFDRDEPNFRTGFEVALYPENRGKAYDDVAQQLRMRYPAVFDREAFRKGYERGRAYLQALGEEKRGGAAW